MIQNTSSVQQTVQKPKDSSFTIKYDKDKQQIFSFWSLF